MSESELEFVDEDDAALDPDETISFSDAVLYSSDWTVETVISQMSSSNIEMNPRFQRRDAWSAGGKSRFIESIILGFPIPQIVLAEKREKGGNSLSWMESKDSSHFFNLLGTQRVLRMGFA